MAKLILSMDGLVLKEIPLTQERLTIGRKPQNDIQIDNLAVSGEHAVVVTILNDSFLEDMNSTNGTLVNGQSVKKHFLKNGDVIEFSKYKLKYFAEAIAPIQTTDFEKDLMVAPDRFKLPSLAELTVASVAKPRQVEPALKSVSDIALKSKSAPAPEAANDALPPAAMRLINGASAGRQLELTRTLTSLGKHGVQVAVIARKPCGYCLMQSEGSRFPEVNGKVMDVQEHVLQDKDIIELAGIKMEFFLKPRQMFGY
jgi:FHA domain